MQYSSSGMTALILALTDSRWESSLLDRIRDWRLYGSGKSNNVFTGPTAFRVHCAD
jgi:hypothetical protein